MAAHHSAPACIALRRDRETYVYAAAVGTWGFPLANHQS